VFDCVTKIKVCLAMSTSMRRLENEIKHGIKISDSAESIWGWGTSAGQPRANRRGKFF